MTESELCPSTLNAQIEDVRELLGDLATETPSFLSDGTIRRFLRARNWSTEKAAKSLKEAIKWRRQFKPETICWVLESFVTIYGGLLFGNDKIDIFVEKLLS